MTWNYTPGCERPPEKYTQLGDHAWESQGELARRRSIWDAAQKTAPYAEADGAEMEFKAVNPSAVTSGADEPSKGPEVNHALTPVDYGHASEEFAYTVFKSVNELTTCEHVATTWEALVPVVVKPLKYKRREDQPLLKLANFGDKRTPRGSLRHDANVDIVFGVEGDYDEELVTPAQGAALLRAAGIKAAIYTSSSNGVVSKKSKGGPRWRVLAPLSAPIVPAERYRYVSLLNGVLGGILATESWTLSQTYYYGQVEGVPFEAYDIEGEYLDVWEMCGDAAPIDPPTPVKSAVTLDRPREAKDANDPAVQFISDLGIVKQFSADGKVYVECPWSDEHTGPDASVSTTSYFPRGLGGRADPGFECLHAHCKGRNGADFLRKIGFDKPVDDFNDLPVAAGSLLPAFDRNTNGKIKPTRGNLLAAMERAELCGAQIRFDTFHGEIMLAPVGTEEWRAFEDSDYTALCKQMEYGQTGFADISRDRIREMVHFVANENKFDSAQHWLNRLEWDGVPRVETFLSAYLGVEDNDYTRAVSKYLWTALPGRVLSPGIKADMVPVLSGPQGAGKSSVVSAIAPSEKEYHELDLSKQDDDQGREMRGKLVIEFGELKGLRAREQEALKAFIVRKVDSWIPKYMEMQIQYPRRSIFIGTTNSKEFLTDDTGHRRWLPVDVPERKTPAAVVAAVEAVVRDRDQLWAEGAAMFKADGIAWAVAEHLAKAETPRFEVVDAWVGAIHGWVDAEDFPDESNKAAKRGDRPFTTAQVLVGAIGVPLDRITDVMRKRAAQVLRSLGYADRRYAIDGRRDNWFEKVGA